MRYKLDNYWNRTNGRGRIPVYEDTNLTLELDAEGSIEATRYNNQRKFVTASNGDMYFVLTVPDSVYYWENQIRCYKYDGSTLVNMNFPTFPGYNNEYPTIAIDSNDIIHIAWGGSNSASLNSSIPQLMYITHDGRLWSTIQTIQETSYYHDIPTMVIDSAGYVHITTTSFVSSKLRLEYYKSTNTINSLPLSWSTRLDLGIDSYYKVYWGSLDVDSSNNPHIAAVGWINSDNNTKVIVYKKFNGSTWSTWEEISFTNAYGYVEQDHPCMLIDSLDNIHVVWEGMFTETYPQTRYVKYNGTSWSDFITIDGSNSQYFPILALDNSDVLHVYWQQIATLETLYDIMHIKNTSGTWDYEALSFANSTTELTYPSTQYYLSDGSSKFVYTDIDNDKVIINI